MSELSRRRFLQYGAGLTAATAATMLTPSIARAAAIEGNHRTRSIRDVEHIVVLTQENRSFDHYFGTMRGVRGYGDPHPVTLPSGKRVFHQPDGSGEVLPFRPDLKDAGLAFLQDLDHGWDGGHRTLNRGLYDQWVPNKTAATMAYLTRKDIPFHYALADAFTVCDAYHCSLLGPTDPNRYYLWTGSTGGAGTGGGPVIANDELGYSWTTYPERLQQAGVSWKIYQDAGDGLERPKRAWRPDHRQRGRQPHPRSHRARLGCTACAATVERGLGDGRYAEPVVHHFTIPGLRSLTRCPNMGVTVQRRSSPVAELVVTWFVAPPEITNSIYLLRHFQVVSGSVSGEFPSYVGSQDFNGDRLGDVWESTDENEEFTTWLRQGTGFVQGPAEFRSVEPLPPVVFGQLDNTPGTDLAAGYTSKRRDQIGMPGTAGTGALVVFGKSGGRVLLEHDPTGQTHYVPALLDANHDGNLDVQVSGGPMPPRIYLGDGAGHFVLAG